MTMTLSRRHGKSAPVEKDTAGFEALFEQHWDRLCGVLFRLVGDWAEAEDLALETFVQLYRRPPAVERNLGGWLYRVGTNLGLNALRARKRRQLYEEQAGTLDLQDHAPDDPAKTVERNLEQQQVRATLAAMKPRSAQILILRHSGLSYAEIAAALDVSPASVGTLLARAEGEFEKKFQHAEGSVKDI